MIIGGIAVVFSNLIINDCGLCACLAVDIDCRGNCVCV